MRFLAVISSFNHVFYNTHYLKILSLSPIIESLREKGAPYQGAKEHYLIEEDQLTHLGQLPVILHDIAESLPEKKKKKPKASKRK